MPSWPPDLSLQELYAAETARIREQFERSADGSTALVARADLVDAVVRQLHAGLLERGETATDGFCLVALGGYGRRALFPHSDVDLLFLWENSRVEDAHHEAAGSVSRALWDLQLRLSPAARRLEECEQFDRDNPEFSIALLDCRCLAGDARLFARLREQVIPRLAARDHQEIMTHLLALTCQRHARHGNTIFELEPNIKEAPGGLRDYQLAGWLVLLAELERNRRWVTPEGLWPAALGEDCHRTFDFVAAARCFLHYRQKRDFNQLTYEFQAEAAALGIGHRLAQALPAEQWMRSYFRHARSVHRLATQLLEEAAAARSSLYDVFLDRRSRLSNAEFTVSRGRIFLRQPAIASQPDALLSVFEFMARHDLPLSAEAERVIEQALPHLASKLSSGSATWQRFRHLLLLPAAADALRAMHRLGVLDAVFPEFALIDSLVVRDFYHRYTVDEHSFQAIQNLHGLCAPREEAHKKLAEIFAELEQPELLLFALLFHDVGKGTAASDHIQGSLEAAEAIMARLAFEPADRDAVRFLIAHHLRMSATLLRRDIFEPETVRKFAEIVGTPERLKMLCLFTFADIRAVNPQALTPWKAEMLWQLYAAASNHLARHIDEYRIEQAGTEALLEGIQALLPATATPEKLGAFLEGFPRRYLSARQPEEIAAHYQMARRLAKAPVQLSLHARPHDYELTVLTADRPGLFASLTGVLTAWGMNILKADAFANRAGIVLDTFRFADPHRTFQLNPGEVARFEKSLMEVLSGHASLETLLRGRLPPQASAGTKISVATQIRFEDDCSAHSTLLELITQDRPGLLYQVSTVLAELGCNIEVALIDTEGQKVIDVFYLTSAGAKLDPGRQQALREALLHSL